MAKCKGTKVSPKEAEKMLELYEKLGTYKAVGEKLKRNPDTVARHIQAYQLGVHRNVL